MTRCLPHTVTQLLLLATALAGFPHVNHLPASLLVFFALMWLWRGLGEWRRVYLPNKQLLSLITIVAIGLLYINHPKKWGLDAGAAVFLVALALKQLELNTARDVYLCSFLTLIVTAAQFLYTQSIGNSLLGLIICVLIFSAWVRMHESSNPSRHSLQLSLVLLIQALPMAIALFLVVPRFQVPKWMILQDDQQRAKTGLSDVLKPGSINELLLSPNLVFRVKFKGTPPPNNQLYWRGPVFSFSDGESWRMSDAYDVVRFQDDIAFSGQRYDYTLLLEPQDQPWVYALDLPAEYDLSMRRNASYQLFSQIKAGDSAEFSLSSYPNYNTGYITKTEYRENRQLPGEPSPKMRALVERLHAEEGQPERYIDNVLNFFRDSGFSYTLQPPLLNDNRVEQFIFESKQGYCEHYATAFVYLMRLADIPARVVSGFQGGQFNSVGDFYEIRQANAHAWAEVWLQGKGWLRVDPTTAILPDRVEQSVNVDNQVATGNISLSNTQTGSGVDHFALGVIGLIWDNVDYQWQRWIVRYGNDQQKQLINQFGLEKPGLIGFWGLYALALILALIALSVLGKRRIPEDKAVCQYRKFCTKLSKRGVVNDNGEGLLSFAVRAKQQFPEQAELIESITGSFIRLRYHREPTPQDLSTLIKSVSKLKV